MEIIIEAVVASVVFVGGMYFGLYALVMLAKCLWNAGARYFGWDEIEPAVGSKAWYKKHGYIQHWGNRR